MREGEKDGVNYHFVSVEEFKKGIEQDEFLEYAIVHGNYYGTLLQPVKEALSQGKLVIFDIDVQGNVSINSRLGDITTSVFITPPSLSELKKRLLKRGTDSEDVIKQRIENAKKEMQRVTEYDFLLINDNFEESAEKLKLIAKTARMKCPSEEINEFIQKWEEL